ncbi:hypothetical protein [Mycolicibacterium llatzerense]|uniref:hypothetical protein n=1 Tax=Mycolicibacterium llatzerense TaxID=280871 RepID=UPI0013A6F83C|nr:hypothetical protein [Mycolicibacterium llatzerense]
MTIDIIIRHHRRISGNFDIDPPRTDFSVAAKGSPVPTKILPSGPQKWPEQLAIMGTAVA